MDDLIAFLRAQLDKDQAAAEHENSEEVSTRFNTDSDATGDDFHYHRWSPDRVLADVAAKRRIIEIHEGPHSCGFSDYDDADPCPTLRLLALPYASHPDYREEWKP